MWIMPEGLYIAFIKAQNNYRANRILFHFIVRILRGIKAAIAAFDAICQVQYYSAKYKLRCTCCRSPIYELPANAETKQKNLSEDGRKFLFSCSTAHNTKCSQGEGKK